MLILKDHGLRIGGSFMLEYFVLLLTVLVGVSFLNEKLFKLPNEILLLIASILIALIYSGISAFSDTLPPNPLPTHFLDDFLVKGVLCFILFAGSCTFSFKKVKKSVKTIFTMSIVTTLLAAIFYGTLSYLVFSLIPLVEIDFLHHLLIGCIISPTDPIAAMSILRKIGISEEIETVIEGESLFNDGVGISLFIIVGSAIKSGSNQINIGEFFSTLTYEICFAVAIALAISFVLFKLFSKTNDCNLQIFTSILAVSTCYVICEAIGCSSAIASVICGMYFASKTTMEEDRAHLSNYFVFWNIADNLLNGLLYIILGLTFINLFVYINHNILAIVFTVIISILARYLSVFISTPLLRPLPEKLPPIKFTNLMTYSGIKGALSLALVLSASEYFTTDGFNTAVISVAGVVLFTTLIQGLSIGKFYKRFYMAST